MMRQEPGIQHRRLTHLERAFRLVLLFIMIFALPATLLATMGAALAEHQSLHGIFCDEVNHDGLLAKLQAIPHWETW
jgi:hypothetical protein